MTDSNLNFEEAFARLEKILDIMNEGKVPLDQSLSLFEEADELIKKCDKFLSSSEKKIETLIKNRSSNIELDENSQPLTEEFSNSNTQIFSEDNLS